MRKSYGRKGKSGKAARRKRKEATGGKAKAEMSPVKRDGKGKTEKKEKE